MADNNEQDETFSSDEKLSGQSQNPLLEKPKWYKGIYPQMIFFYLSAVVIALAHHFVYAHLNGRSVQSDSSTSLKEEFHLGISDQSLVNFIGNIIGQSAQMCFSAVIATAFAQIFWHRLRTNPSTVKHIDTALSFNSQLYNLFAWKAMTYMPWLVGTALCAFLMTFVSTVTPGSLTVAPGSFDLPCTVPIVDLTNADLMGPGFPTGRTQSFAARVLMAGTYFAPATNPCGTCEYNISFVAPTMQCANITQAVDMNSLLQPGDWAWVYHGDWAWTKDYLEIASKSLLTTTPDSTDLAPDNELPVIALNCTGYKATYHVTVSQNITTSLIVNDVEVGPQLLGVNYIDTPNTPDQQVYAVWDALAGALAGDVLWVYGPYNEFTANSTFTIAYSPIGTKPGTYIPWVWPEDLSIFIPNIMQNVSLSLLSGVLSDTRNNTIGSQDTTCRTYGLQYVYDRTRLLATYGAALLLTAVFLILGILTSHNGRVESFGFTRVLAAYPLDKTLTLDTQVVVGNDGRLDESRT